MKGITFNILINRNLYAIACFQIIWHRIGTSPVVLNKNTYSIDKLLTSELCYLFWATKRLKFLEQSRTICRSDSSIAKDTSTNTTQMWASLYWPCGCVLSCNSRITREELAIRYLRLYLALQHLILKPERDGRVKENARKKYRENIVRCDQQPDVSSWCFNAVHRVNLINVLAVAWCAV